MKRKLIFFVFFALFFYDNQYGMKDWVNKFYEKNKNFLKGFALGAGVAVVSILASKYFKRVSLPK
jgi:hypothetical protein